MARQTKEFLYACTFTLIDACMSVLLDNQHKNNVFRKYLPKILKKNKSLYSDGKKFHQYQQNEQSHAQIRFDSKIFKKQESKHEFIFFNCMLNIEYLLCCK